MGRASRNGQKSDASNQIKGQRQAAALGRGLLRLGRSKLPHERSEQFNFAPCLAMFAPSGGLRTDGREQGTVELRKEKRGKQKAEIRLTPEITKAAGEKQELQTQKADIGRAGTGSVFRFLLSAFCFLLFAPRGRTPPGRETSAIAPSDASARCPTPTIAGANGMNRPA